MRLILGSASPRRNELMKGLDLEFVCDFETSFVESIDNNMFPELVPLEMSRGKSHFFHRPLEKDELLITADTIVIIGSPDSHRKVLGKPHSKEEAISMLKALSGATHEVVTGVTMRTADKETSFSDSTLVTFEKLSDSDIEYYLEKYRPYDKAGSYGVQEWIGYVGISRIEGSFYNVMGFPVHKVWKALKSFR